jgi:DNA-binding MarR family transcriptional regulator
MRFEDAIKSSKFQSENQKAQLNILYTASILKCFFNAYFKKYDLTTEQYNVMRIVRGQSPKSVKVKDISSRILSRNSNTTRIIDKLEVKKLLKRSEANKDKRAVNVTLTDEGIALLKRIDDGMLESSPHLKSLEETEAGVLTKLLDKMRTDFDNYTEE